MGNAKKNENYENPQGKIGNVKTWSNDDILDPNKKREDDQPEYRSEKFDKETGIY